jgi:glycerol-3-phosphate dehydrogenase (NAD(P)+)
MKFAIIGGGSWGSALAIHLAKNKQKVKVWEFFEQQAREMQEKRVCPLLPNEPLHENIFVSHKMEEVIPESQAVILVVPSDKVEVTLLNAINFIQDQPIIICSKGFAGDIKLISEVVKSKVKNEVYCLYGPTHAEEVCKAVFTGIVLAGKGKMRNKIKKAFQSANFKVELSNDIIGVQVAAALKNILAVFIGVVDGAKLGDNTKAYLMTKGLAEIQEVGIKMGAKKETFYGLAGIGDVIVTCTSQHSRNHFVGEEVGKGKKLDEVLAGMKMVAEGITTLKSVPLLRQKFGLELPILYGLYQIMFENKEVKEVLEGL